MDTGYASDDGRSKLELEAEAQLQQDIARVVEKAQTTEGCNPEGHQAVRDLALMGIRLDRLSHAQQQDTNTRVKRIEQAVRYSNNGTWKPFGRDTGIPRRYAAPLALATLIGMILIALEIVRTGQVKDVMTGVQELRHKVEKVVPGHEPLALNP